MISCGMSPHQVAQMTLEQQLGVYMGLQGNQDVVTFQSVREMNQFMMAGK